MNTLYERIEDRLVNCQSCSEWKFREIVKEICAEIEKLKEIHPKQEAKSPEIEQALKDLDKLKVQGAHLIDKCTELERLIDKK